jgi:hypothetical protein
VKDRKNQKSRNKYDLAKAIGLTTVGNNHHEDNT